MEVVYKKYEAWTACLLWLCILGVGVHGQKCAQAKPISGNCKFQTDQGVIDLSAIDSASGPYFKDVPSTTKGSSNTYSYNPCTPFTEGDLGSDCDNQLVCQSAGGSTYPLGDNGTATCKNDDKGQLYIQYNSGSRTTQVFLECDKTTKGKFAPEDDTATEETYPMTVTGSVACPGAGGGGGGGGLSTGSILCIVLLCVVLSYLLFGSLFMYFARGNRGVEVIPNVSFWKDFPGLVKDGAVFSLNKCRPKGSTYDSI